MTTKENTHLKPEAGKQNQRFGVTLVLEKSVVKMLKKKKEGSMVLRVLVPHNHGLYITMVSVRRDSQDYGPMTPSPKTVDHMRSWSQDRGPHETMASLGPRL